MEQIKFSKNWNNKLNCDCFTTIRLYNEDKWKFYHKLCSCKDDVSILLNDETKCIAKIIDLNVLMLKDIPDWIIMLDIGTDNKDEFYVLMEKMYGRKSEWKQNLTSMILLFIKKERDI